MLILILFEQYEPRLVMGEPTSAILLHIQTDRQVILDPGRTNWLVSPTQVNQESGVGGGVGDRWANWG